MSNKLISAIPASNRLMGIAELMAYTSLGRNSAMKLGIDSGAKIKIGGRVLYDRQRIDRYINELEED